MGQAFAKLKASAPKGHGPPAGGALDHHRPAQHLHPSRMPEPPRQLRLRV